MTYIRNIANNGHLGAKEKMSDRHKRITYLKIGMMGCFVETQVELEILAKEGD